MQLLIMFKITRFQVDSTGHGNVDLDVKLNQDSWVRAGFHPAHIQNLRR